VEFLMDMLNDDEEAVRISAIYGLAKLGLRFVMQRWGA
jgi:hypothetical protein